MKVKLVLIQVGEKEILGELLKEYQQEMLESGKLEEYKYLDSYWQEEERKAYFIKINNEIAGFVLINKHTVVEKEARSIAEFYVKKRFRCKGVGKMAARLVFANFLGKWEVAERMDNIAAQAFWRKVIEEYTRDNYREVILNNEEWRGPVQIFESK